MKKFLVMVTMLLFASSAAFADNFSPTQLKLTTPNQVYYSFDGSTAQIPVNVSGRAATTIFMVYTRDKAESIGMVKNGFMGWHTVNKIDTCVYWKNVGQLDIGDRTINWDGKDTFGNMVPAGSYTYYLWAYDSQTSKQPAMTAVNVIGLNSIEAFDAQGMPLANPVFYIRDTVQTDKTGLIKWPVGLDPLTAKTDLENTTASRSDEIFPWGGNITLDPTDHSMFWQSELSTGKTLYVTKYKWVPNGASTVEQSWGENGSFTWSTQPAGAGTFGPGVVGDGSDILFSSFVNQYDKEAVSQLLYLSMGDGTQMQIVDLSSWYCSKEDSDLGGQLNGGPSQINFRNGRLFTQGQQSCMALALDPYREQGDEILWVNDNGDYVHDHNFESDATAPWMCNDFMVGPYMYTLSTDSNEFCAFPAYDLGAVTFGLIGPDGTGIDYFAVSGETANYKQTARLLDEGSAYDGMYLDNNASSIEDQRSGSWYVAYDTTKGVLSNQVGVANTVPAAFSVAQNSPNPFNPSTTISFTLNKAGKTTVEVYNVAGQKVSTLVNGNLSAGSHSVVWNAAQFSAGVYFYTVKSESHSRTMKMILLK